ncbi:unnamed protein product, partial [Staurois parvus]
MQDIVNAGSGESGYSECRNIYEQATLAEQVQSHSRENFQISQNWDSIFPKHLKHCCWGIVAENI